MLNQNLEAMAKQLYDYWFVQFDFPDEEGKPYKSNGGAMRYDAVLKRDIPASWLSSCLSEIANITMGQSPDGASYNEVGQGTIFYQGSTDFGMRFPSIRQYTTEPSRFANKGDILMSVRAPVGATNIANNDCCIGRGLAALNSKMGSPTHLYYILDGLRTAFEQRNAAGTTFGSITKDDLYNLPIVKPSESVIKAFEKCCKPIFDKQLVIGKEINSLIEQRNELLPLLMNGQVSVTQLNSDLLFNWEISEFQPVIDLSKFLLPQSQVSSCNSRGAVVENLAELDKGHFCLVTGRFDYLPAKCLSHRVRAEMRYLQTVFFLNFFKDYVYPLNRKYLFLL